MFFVGTFIFSPNVKVSEGLVDITFLPSKVLPGNLSIGLALQSPPTFGRTG
jgi:hypothetical protein